MRTGLLNKPIDILRPQVTINDYGEKQMDYINITTVGQGSLTREAAGQLRTKR